MHVRVGSASTDELYACAEKAVQAKQARGAANSSTLSLPLVLRSPHCPRQNGTIYGVTIRVRGFVNGVSDAIDDLLFNPKQGQFFESCTREQNSGRLHQQGWHFKHFGVCSQNYA